MTNASSSYPIKLDGKTSKIFSALQEILCVRISILELTEDPKALVLLYLRAALMPNKPSVCFSVNLPEYISNTRA